MRITVASPSFKARMAGVFYLLTFAIGGLATATAGKLIHEGDAAATATSIMAHPMAYRVGFAAYLIVVFCYLVVTALFYELFKPVSRTISRIAAMFSLAGCAIQALICLFLLAPFVLLAGDPYLGAFTPEQLRSLNLVFLNLYGQGWYICFATFGVYCLLIGYLIFKSTFMPRVLGVFMAIAGLGWLMFLDPPFAERTFPYILAAGLFGEGSLTLWLLVKGVNVAKWDEKNSRVRA